jgi:hypothetical protein
MLHEIGAKALDADQDNIPVFCWPRMVNGTGDAVGIVVCKFGFFRLYPIADQAERIRRFNTAIKSFIVELVVPVRRKKLIDAITCQLVRKGIAGKVMQLVVDNEQRRDENTNIQRKLDGSVFETYILYGRIPDPRSNPKGNRSRHTNDANNDPPNRI